MKKRLKPDDRKAQIIAIAMEEAERLGIHNVNRARICERLNISRALVNCYMGGMDDLQDAMAQEALASGNIPVLAQLLALGHPYVVGSLSHAAKANIVDYLMNR